MRTRHLSPIFLAALAFFPIGCGTMVNLVSVPQETSPPGYPRRICSMAPATCFPFGGFTRSVMLGGFCTVGSFGAVTEVGNGGLLMGAGMMGAGIWTLAVDAPLSLAGDIVTFPIAYARMKGAPWATWWGEKAQDWKQMPIESPPVTETPPADAPPAAGETKNGLPVIPDPPGLSAN